MNHKLFTSLMVFLINRPFTKLLSPTLPILFRTWTITTNSYSKSNNLITIWPMSRTAEVTWSCSMAPSNSKMITLTKRPPHSHHSTQQKPRIVPDIGSLLTSLWISRIQRRSSWWRVFSRRTNYRCKIKIWDASDLALKPWRRIIPRTSRSTREIRAFKTMRCISIAV